MRKKLGFGGFGDGERLSSAGRFVRVRCSALFGSSTHARDPPRSTRFICSQVRCLPEETIRETRDRLPGINGVCARHEPELETADVLQLLLGITPEKQVVCLLVLVGLDRPLGFPVQMHPRRPRVVAVRAHVIAVEQRVIVDTMALGRPIHTHTGLTVPDHVMVHDEVPTVIVEVDAGVGTLAPVVVKPTVCDARALPVSSIHMNQPEILTHQSGIRDVVVANVVSRSP